MIFRFNDTIIRCSTRLFQFMHKPNDSLNGDISSIEFSLTHIAAEKYFFYIAFETCFYCRAKGTLWSSSVPDQVLFPWALITVLAMLSYFSQFLQRAILLSFTICKCRISLNDLFRVLLRLLSFLSGGFTRCQPQPLSQLNGFFPSST